jgi:hypothetical protein
MNKKNGSNYYPVNGMVCQILCSPECVKMRETVVCGKGPSWLASDG